MTQHVFSLGECPMFPLKMSAPGGVSYKCGEVALLVLVGLSVTL